MEFDKSQLILYAVTDQTWTGTQTLYEQVEAALKGGATCIQLREKEMDKKEIIKEAREIRNLCHAYKVPLIINDYADVALAADADGVHIGQSDLDAGSVRKLIGNGILGVSVHSVEEAREAIRNGADYLGVGAIFSTKTKKDASHVPQELMESICRESSVPVLAIGGIKQDNILDLSGKGLDGIAVISAIFAQPDIEKASRDLRSLSEKMVSEKGN